jgi:acetoin utilization deacetylase AcuC-like enzyme
MIPVYYHPGYFAPIGDSHTMPMRKFAWVAAELQQDASALFFTPDPITQEDLLRVHTSDYVDAIRTGDPLSLAEGQKFPWSPELYPAVRLTNGGVYAAAKHALSQRVACALASGFHHACSDHGEGFCTFNGLVVAIDRLRAEGHIRTAAILDLDLHYGNGTAQLAASRPYLTAISIYGNDYWNNLPYRDVETVRHHDGSNHFSATLPNGSGGECLFVTLERMLPRLLERNRPDLILYQAGADPYHEDPYSPLQLDHADLMERDRRVFAFCKTHQIPIAWVLAGGYTKDTRKVVQVHVNTFEACKSVFLNLPHPTTTRIVANHD